MKRQSRNKIIVGLTGTFGSGKTTVARMLRSQGALIIDADRIVHGLLRSDKAVRARIRKAFGPAIFGKDGRIDRKRLGSLVFENRRLIKKLNAIVHPQVIKTIRQDIKKAVPAMVVIDAPLLIEAGLRRAVDKVIVVVVDPRKRMERLLAKTALSRSQIAQRTKAQMPQAVKRRFADFVIDNSGSLTGTARQVKKVSEEIVNM